MKQTVLLLLLACTATSEDPTSSTVYVSTPQQLILSLLNPEVETVFLTRSIVLDRSDSGTPSGVSVHIGRSLIVSAAPNYMESNTYVLLDFRNTGILISLGPGIILTFLGLELRNLFDTVGYRMLPLFRSEVGTVLLDSCLVHRGAGLPSSAAVAAMMAAVRPAALSGSQQCSVTSNLSYSTTSSPTPVTDLQAVSVVDFATFVQLDSSDAGAGYIEQLLNSYDIADQYASEQCLYRHTEHECILQLLEQHEGSDAGGTPHEAPSKVIVVVAAATAAFAALVGATVAVLAVRRGRRCRDGALFVSLSHRQASTADATEVNEVIVPCTVSAVSHEGNKQGGCWPQGLQHQQREQEEQRRRRRRNGGIAAPSGGCSPASSFLTCSFPTTAVAPTTDFTAPSTDAAATDATEAARPLAATAASGLGHGSGYGCNEADVGAGRLSGWSMLASDLGPLLSLCRRPPSGPRPPVACDTAITTDARASLTTSLRTLSLSLDGVGDDNGNDGSGDDDSASWVDFIALPRSVTSDFMALHANPQPGLAGINIGSASGQSRCDSQAGAGRSISAKEADAGAAAPGRRAAAAAALGTAMPAAPARLTGFRRDLGVAARDEDADSGVGHGDEDDGDGGGGGSGRGQAGGSRLAIWGMCKAEGRSQRSSFQEARLQLQVVLGCGSYGTVYKGTWQGLPVAVKTLVFSASDDSLRRALREATLGAGVSHCNIVATYSVEVEPVPRGAGGGGVPDSCGGAIATTAVAAAAMAAQIASVSRLPGVCGGGDGGGGGDAYVTGPRRKGSGAGGDGAGDGDDGLYPSGCNSRADESGAGHSGATAAIASGVCGSGDGDDCWRSSCVMLVMDWRLHIIQEYADAGPLWRLYGSNDLWPKTGCPKLPAVVSLALGIARALALLHSKRIIHGDLNPDNVLLKRDLVEPSGFTVKVGDFGLSVTLPQDHSHLSNLYMGTVFYVCPAVVLKGQVGPPSDVFSLGVMLWELYHGRRAGTFTDQGPRYSSAFPAFPPSCPEAYRAVALHCLQRQPQNRPSAALVEAQLEQLLAASSSRGAVGEAAAFPGSPLMQHTQAQPHQRVQPAEAGRLAGAEPRHSELRGVETGAGTAGGIVTTAGPSEAGRTGRLGCNRRSVDSAYAVDSRVGSLAAADGSGGAALGPAGSRPGLVAGKVLVAAEPVPAAAKIDVQGRL